MVASDRIPPDEKTSDGDHDAPSPAAAFSDAAERLRELRDYAAYYVSAKLDKLKLTARKAIIFAVLGIVGLFVAVTLVIMSVVLLCLGIAGGLGALLGTRSRLQEGANRRAKGIRRGQLGIALISSEHGGEAIGGG